MKIDPNLLIAAKMIHDECVKYGNCDCCKIKFACSFSGIPSTWEIPDPPPEPTERPRIEWARMLPDEEAFRKELWAALEKLRKMECEEKC